MFVYINSSRLEPVAPYQIANTIHIEVFFYINISKVIYLIVYS